MRSAAGHLSECAGRSNILALGETSDVARFARTGIPAATENKVFDPARRGRFPGRRADKRRGPPKNARTKQPARVEVWRRRRSHRRRSAACRSKCPSHGPMRRSRRGPERPGQSRRPQLSYTAFYVTLRSASRSPGKAVPDPCYDENMRRVTPQDRDRAALIYIAALMTPSSDSTRVHNPPMDDIDKSTSRLKSCRRGADRAAFPRAQGP